MTCVAVKVLTPQKYSSTDVWSWNPSERTLAKPPHLFLTASPDRNITLPVICSSAEGVSPGVSAHLYKTSWKQTKNLTKSHHNVWTNPHREVVWSPLLLSRQPGQGPGRDELVCSSHTGSYFCLTLSSRSSFSNRVSFTCWQLSVWKSSVSRSFITRSVVVWNEGISESCWQAEHVWLQV